MVCCDYCSRCSNCGGHAVRNGFRQVLRIKNKKALGFTEGFFIAGSGYLAHVLHGFAHGFGHGFAHGLGIGHGLAHGVGHGLAQLVLPHDLTDAEQGVAKVASSVGHGLAHRFGH